ncbi:MAG: M50 family metallopeptidase [Myxococcales bacterium]|nr:M50 family metallopeptidase [Polyangiaceae bacterium]MDW8250364.1 M50 family metallopeptidase [Myxococcales bacterium]
MNLVHVLAAIAGLGVLMIVHETGHYLAARAFGMRVVKFSLGMAPILWRFQPKGSPTTFQIGAIPFFAYVQIAGMNPLEEIDPTDKESYANASLTGRIVTILAGSLANYLVASVFFLAAILISGEPRPTTVVTVLKDQPAAQAGMMDNDRVLEVEDIPVTNWDGFRAAVSKRPNQPTKLLIERKGERMTLTVTPAPTGENGAGLIGARTVFETVPVPLDKAFKLAVKMPPLVVYELVSGLAKVVTGKQKAELGGPAAIVKEGAKAMKNGVGDLLQFLGVLSANLAGFNLLPVPALDGGRLIFLGYEALSRRRPDAMVEAHVHLVGFVMLLALMVFVTWNDLFGQR